MFAAEQVKYMYYLLGERERERKGEGEGQVSAGIYALVEINYKQITDHKCEIVETGEKHPPKC